jgi:hypothetical protein
MSVIPVRRNEAALRVTGLHERYWIAGSYFLRRKLCAEVAHVVSVQRPVSQLRRGGHIAWWFSDRYGRRAAGRQRCRRHFPASNRSGVAANFRRPGTDWCAVGHSRK